MPLWQFGGRRGLRTKRHHQGSGLGGWRDLTLRQQRSTTTLIRIDRRCAIAALYIDPDQRAPGAFVRGVDRQQPSGCNRDRVRPIRRDEHRLPDRTNPLPQTPKLFP
jgi:hypothetical protein